MMLLHEQETQQLWLPFEKNCFHLLQQSQRHGKAFLLQIHAFILRHAIETNLQIFTKFLVVSASSVGISYARKLFDEMPHREEDSFLCNSMIKAYLETRHSFAFYRDLRKETSFAPDNYTFNTLTKSCSLSMCVYEGLQLHSQIWRTGFCEDMYVSTGVIDMYAKFGKMKCARNVFDKMPKRSEVSWTALIRGYARCGELEVASKLFDNMPVFVFKDVVIYNAMIDGYVKSGDMTSARRLFNKTTVKSVVTWTTMIHGYCNSKDVESARLLFDVMPVKNLVSWNTMIGGYCQNKQPQEAIRLFQEMQATTSLVPDDVTILSVLPAISDTGALGLGEWCHRFVQRRKLDKKVKVCTAVLDMYSKCGEIEKAERIFNEMIEKELASWNAMIHGYALNGNARAALDLFSTMLKEVKPDEVTMLAVFSACNHGGLVEEGRKWFDKMEGFGLIAKIEHYGCMIDLLGRAGQLNEAEDLIANMPFEPNGIILSSFLSACGLYKDMERAERILKKAAELEPKNDGNYVLMSNLYAADSRWDDVGKVKNMMRKNEAKKEVGFSSIEIDSIVSEFISGDTVHPHRSNIHLVLGKLLMHMKDEEAH